jgi:hypothetical protein
MTYYEIKAYVSCNKKIIEKCEITREKIIKFNSLYFELSEYLRAISIINDKFCVRYNVNYNLIICCFVGGENADIEKIKRKFLKKVERDYNDNICC